MKTSDPKFYVASRSSLRDRMHMWRAFRAAGNAVTSTWIDADVHNDQSDAWHAEMWEKIGAEVAACDALIFYAELDDFPMKGALVEIGMALALKKRVLAVLPGVTLEPKTYRPVGSWVCHPLVSVVTSLEEAMKLC